MRKKRLEEILRKHADLLDDRLVVEPQAVIRLKPKRDVTAHQKQKIHAKVEANRGCYDHVKKEWILPNFIAPIRLPSSEKKPSRLHIRTAALQNVLFLRDLGFRGTEPWKDIETALKSFRPERHPYSKATCRDYLAMLRALQPESAQA